MLEAELFFFLLIFPNVGRRKETVAGGTIEVFSGSLLMSGVRVWSRVSPSSPLLESSSSSTTSSSSKSPLLSGEEFPRSALR